MSLLRNVLLKSSIVVSITTAGFLYADKIPEDLLLTRFADKDLTPCPACVTTSVNGDVFVGVDLQGSLGREGGKGHIVKLIDKDKDGVADTHTLFAKVENPRGLIAMGDKLYVLHTVFNKEKTKALRMDLSVFEDNDQNGVADGEAKPLIQNVSSSKILADRGTDHSTNGIRMGIDGWIYIAIGDYGFANAEDREGTKLTLLGGGILRVRPDGTEMEIYTTGMRNIYDVAIDPFMNIFTRGNTNDGGGWNVRFNHHIQSAEYGYPRLFKNFPGDILPALADVGGGSGVGALYLDEATWPEQYNKRPLMADWGKQKVIMHPVREDGATFQQEETPLLSLSQVTDLDVDASGQMFLTAWEGAGFKGNPEKGYTVRVVPKGWKHKPVSPMDSCSKDDLLEYLISPSSTARLAAQQELILRNEVSLLDSLLGYAKDERLNLEARVAVIYTYAQLAQEDGISKLLDLSKDPKISEFCIRAIGDRIPFIKRSNIEIEPIVELLEKGSDRTKAAAIITLGRIGNKQAVEALLKVPASLQDRSANVGSVFRTIVSGKKSAQVRVNLERATNMVIDVSDDRSRKTVNLINLVNPTFILKDGSHIKLTDLEWNIIGFDAKEALKNKSGDGSVLSSKNESLKKRLEFGLGFTAPSKLLVTLPENVVSFDGELVYAENSEKYSDVGVSIIPTATSSKEALHSTPDSSLVLPHLAAQALIKLKAGEECLEALGTPSGAVAAAALRHIHDEDLVDRLIARLQNVDNEAVQETILTILARLYKKEAPFDGSWWWTTRPDTRGPYYKAIEWAATDRIKKALEEAWENATPDIKYTLTSLNDLNRLGIEVLGTFVEEKEAVEEPSVDLTKIASQVGAVGKTPIEDTILSLEKLKGDVEKGKDLFIRQGCIACHAVDGGGAAKGPYMGQIGSIMNREQIAMAILRPNDTISQGFQTTLITVASGVAHMGFVTDRNADELTMRNIAGQVTKVKISDITSEKHMEQSMMPAGLANALSLEELASLVEYLAENK